MIPLLADQRYRIGPDQLGLAMSLSAIANLVSLPLTYCRRLRMSCG